MADESNIQDEFNGVPGRREQPYQWPRTYNRFQNSNRPEDQKKTKKTTKEEQYHWNPLMNQRSIRVRATSFKIQIDTIITINREIHLILNA